MDIETVMGMLLEIKTDLATKSTSTELQDLVAKINEKEERIVALETSVESMNVQMSKRDEKIDVLEKRIDDLVIQHRATERANNILQITSSLLERKCDDHEQISRKVNLRLIGIELKDDETPDTLLTVIKRECEYHNLNLCDADFDHCHRNGKVDRSTDVPKQTILLKMRSWRARDIVFQNRRKFAFKIYHDLTFRRKNLLNDANNFISTVPEGFVDYALADKNCKLKVKATNGRFYHFNSIEEVYAIFNKLQTEIQMGPLFAQDEKDEVFK